jgi:NADPH2:quinone reductase
MKAIVADKPGGAEVLRLADVEKPGPGAGELLVKVAACGLNPVDYKLRNGYFSVGRKYPAIFGFDVCGQVEEAGAGACFAEGDWVYYFGEILKPGAYAEYHVVNSAIVDHKPANLSPIQAASLPLAGVTAIQGLFRHTRLETGETALIQGAAGGVGSLAVQMAAWKGARVIGSCSGANVNFVKSLGADHVIDYTKGNVAAEAMRITGGAGVDLAFDLVGGESFAVCVDSLGRGGRLVFTNVFANWEKRLMEAINKARPKNLSIHCELAQNSGEDLRTLSSLARNGYVKPQVDRVIAPSQVAEAHKRLETMRGRGKIIIDMSQGF